MSHAVPMPLNTGAIFADTRHLTSAEFGSYMLALIDAWQSAERRDLAPDLLEKLWLSQEQVRRHVDWALHPSMWPDGDWKTVRRAVLLRDGHRCAYCGRTSGPFHVDHIFPRSRGGDNSADNLTVACAPCNGSKGARTPEEWRAC